MEPSISKQSIEINLLPTHSKLFSFCTLVTKPNQYNEMVKSFTDKGFVNDCEYLHINNVDSIQFDAYSAIRKFLVLAKGEYLIFCHQDILAIDDFDKLNQSIKELNNIDSNWAIAANAGGKHIKGLVKCITNGDDSIEKNSTLPQQVYAIDENFFIVKKSALLTVSNKLKGFHFYATDMALMADILGYKTYVIDYMVKHLSKGNYDLNFHNQIIKVKENYSESFRDRFIESPSARLFLSGSNLKMKLFNNTFSFFIVKLWYRFLR
ncbi:MAG: hypothetical protein RL065_239 [Bacteroidota bacterium]